MSILEDSGEEQEMTYDHVIDYIENSEDLSPAEAFKCLSSHRRRAGAWQVEVTWRDGSQTWEPLDLLFR